jgi:hypothetical protein
LTDIFVESALPTAPSFYTRQGAVTNLSPALGRDTGWNSVLADSAAEDFAENNNGLANPRLLARTHFEKPVAIASVKCGVFEEILAPRVGGALIREDSQILHSVGCGAEDGNLVEVIPIGINERIEPTRASILLWHAIAFVLAQRHEAICEVGEIPNPGAGRSHVNIDESSDVPLLKDHVVGSDIVQAHHLDWLVCLHLPCSRLVGERGASIMYPSKQGSCLLKDRQ